MNFWGKINPSHEHVLIFGDDSIVLRHGCVDQFIEYDYVGAPWSYECHFFGAHEPLYGGNGGFRLVRRSTSIKAISNPVIEKWRAETLENQTHSEDLAFVDIFHQMSANFAPRELASGFAVESTWHDKPCGLHQPWSFFTKDKVP